MVEAKTETSRSARQLRAEAECLDQLIDEAKLSVKLEGLLEKETADFALKSTLLGN